jgi:hypothetical protein
MDQGELLKLKLARGLKRAAAIRATMKDPRVRAREVQILARMLGQQNAANLYRQKLAKLSTSR